MCNITSIIYFNNNNDREIIRKFSENNISEELIINSYKDLPNNIGLKLSQLEYISNYEYIIYLVEKNINNYNSFFISCIGLSFDTINKIIFHIYKKKNKKKFKFLININNENPEIIMNSICNLNDINNLMLLITELSKPYTDFEFKLK